VTLSFTEVLIRLLLLVPAVVVAIPVHEMGHAAAAYFLGDRSVRYFGYFKLDPRRYIEPIGLIFVVAWLVGFGRRVPVQSNRINTTGKKVLVELGGPAANLAVAIVLGVLFRALVRAGLPFSYDPGPGLLMAAVFVIVFLNLSIFAFQLLPVPGLDGWNVVETLFRSRNPKFFFNVDMRRREIQAGAVLIVIAAQFLAGFPILWYVMAPFFEPASLISMGTCVAYGTGFSGLNPCPLSAP
jgi:Zn-dependent protease